MVFGRAYNILVLDFIYSRLWHAPYFVLGYGLCPCCAQLPQHGESISFGHQKLKFSLPLRANLEPCMASRWIVGHMVFGHGHVVLDIHQIVVPIDDQGPSNC
jgi:hypothetical protein